MDSRLKAHLLATNPWFEEPELFPVAATGRFARDYVARSILGTEDWPVDGKAHVVVGARQVGKSTWLWHRFRERNTPPLLLDATELLVRTWTDSAALAIRDLLQLVGPRAPVLLEEAQHLAEAGLFVKGLIDGGLPNPLFVTGSSSWHLGARTRESLAGRAVRVRMSPLSLAEVGVGLQGSTPAIRGIQLRRLALRQSVVGGYPEAWLSDGPELILTRLYEAVVVRDASDLYDVQQISGFRRLLELIAVQQGSVANISEWASICEVARSTIVRWLDILQEAQLVYRLRPFAGGRRAETTGRTRVFLCDPGISNAILRRFAPFEERDDRGRLLEAWVGAELHKRINPLRSGEELLFWRTRGGAEVDFVVRRGEEIVGLEVKAKALRRPSLTRSVRSFINGYRPVRFYVVHLGEDMEEVVDGTPVLWRGPERLAEGPL